MQTTERLKTRHICLFFIFAPLPIILFFTYKNTFAYVFGHGVLDTSAIKNNLVSCVEVPLRFFFSIPPLPSFFALAFSSSSTRFFFFFSIRDSSVA